MEGPARMLLLEVDIKSADNGRRPCRKLHCQDEREDHKC